MAKKQYSKIPRKKKKALKKQYNITENITRDVLLDLDAKERARQQRANSQARRYNQNKDYLSKLGIPTNLITKTTSVKETQRRALKYLAEREEQDRKQRQIHLFAKKVNRLIDAGYTQAEAEKLVGSIWKQRSNKDIDRVVDEKLHPINSSIRLRGQNYLYISFAEKVGGFKTYNLYRYSDAELLSLINKRIKEARKHPDDSNRKSFKGVFQFRNCDTKEEAEAFANYYNERGYNLNYLHGALKLDKDRFDKICIANSFTYREFLEMTLTCSSQMLNSQVDDFIDTLKAYDRENGFNFTRNFE